MQHTIPLEADIPADRREVLHNIAAYIRRQQAEGQPANLVFICTHNSRRSHLGQVWAAAAAHWYGVKDIQTYSGGTEATACNPRTVAALQRAGFRIENRDPDSDNPHYFISYAIDAEPAVCFSKVYDDAANPASQFAAIMTCSEAEQNCPFIPGAALRVPLTYNDPKEADDTPMEQLRYDERCRQIAAEMWCLFAQIQS
ncbi:MAG: protein-tyrosine-phosphatase [Saprospiraceae bacterium]|nr:protein-tyrosine-phosphatase [Saprospiraceae bacterium]